MRDSERKVRKDDEAEKPRPLLFYRFYKVLAFGQPIQLINEIILYIQTTG